MKVKKLSRTEEKLMKLIWDYGEDISVQQLLATVKAKYGIEYARTTVVTFLTRMSEKGFVETYRRGRNSFAHPLMSLEDYREQLMKEVYEFWFDKNDEKLLEMLQKAKKSVK